MNRQTLIEKVEAVMDEVNPLEQGETITNVLIDKQLDTAAVSLMEMLPSAIAMPVEAGSLPLSQGYRENFSIEVVCPVDFVRLHRLKLKDWMRSVTNLYPDGDKLFLLQDYDYIKSTFRRPEASLRHQGGQDVITCYPPPGKDSMNEAKDNAVEEFVYVKRPDDATQVHDKLSDLLSWKCAEMVYSIAGQGEHMKLCHDHLAMMIQSKLKYVS